MSDSFEFEFDVLASLPNGKIDEDAVLDDLYEAGCGDALVGLGMPGIVGVSFIRTGPDAESVIADAIKQVMSALPEGSLLREVRPDLVSLAEVAARLGVDCRVLEKRKIPPVSQGGLYRVSEVHSALNKRPGNLSAAIHGTRSWFASAKAAQKINAGISMELTLDPEIRNYNTIFDALDKFEKARKKESKIHTAPTSHMRLLQR